MMLQFLRWANPLSWVEFLTLYAVEAAKSAQLTNADATPAVLNPAYQAGGRVRSHRGKATLPAAVSDIGSTLRCVRVRSSDMVKALWADNDAFGGTCAADIGLYKTAKDGGAVVDADFFASALAIAAAGGPTNVTRESGVLTLANSEKRLWEALGLAADPNLEYDVVATLTVASAAAGTLVLTAEVVGGH